MGNPGYSEQQAKVKRDTKSITEEFTAWLNSVDFPDDDTAKAVYREILAETTNRLQIAEEA